MPIVDRLVSFYDSHVAVGPAALAAHWDDLRDQQNPSVLVALVKADLLRRFEQGERPRVLEYLEAFPGLADDGERVVSLVYEEFCHLQELGEDPDSHRFCVDYARWNDSLASQLNYHRELSRAVGADRPKVRFPRPGDRFDKYRLDSILGVGGVARVFLATEDGLGGRRIALKVAASFGQEPSFLANLDHQNIVPILTVAESESGLFGICMPYRPGLTLDKVIKGLGWGKPPRNARALIEIIRPRGGLEEVPAGEQRAGWAGFPVNGTYSEAIAWIGMSLAQALAYLHPRGVFHRDIKPANILLADREGPQLLDFNLARMPSNSEGAIVAQQGGTLPYMAPEQLQAFLDPDAWKDVDHTADIYSLGLVLRGLLTGQPPAVSKSQGSLAREIQWLLDRRAIPLESVREINPGVPPALESILEKCLANRPADRYVSANDLVRDLERFLQRKPLVTAANPSRIECGVNWLFRNRNLGGLLAVSLVFVIMLFSVTRQQNASDAEINRAEALLDSHDQSKLHEARASFERLHRERPETARTSLGLAMTLGNQSPESQQRAELVRESMMKRDANIVIPARLSRNPGSLTLRLAQGILYLNQKRYDEARTSLLSYIEDDRHSITALTGLATIDEEIGEEDQAIRRWASIVSLAIADQIDRDKVYRIRLHLLELLGKLIDRGFPDRRLVVDGDRIRSLASRFEEQLDALKTEAGAPPTPDARAPDEGPTIRSDRLYSIAFNEGRRRSIRCGLDWEESDSGRAIGDYEEADRSFRRAEKLATQLTGARDRLQQVAMQRMILDRRGRIADWPRPAQIAR